MSKKFTGQWAASPANINTDAPFDVRLVVSNLSDLLSASTYNKGLELYPGIVVAVIESGKESLWSLPNEAALTSMRQTFASASYVPAEATEENVKALGWKKVGADAKVEINGEVKTIQEAINAIVSDVKTKQNSAITVTTEAAVGDGEPVTKETTVLAALNELYQKTNGVATEGNLKALENKVTTLEGTVNGAEMGNAALKSSIDSLQSKVEAIKQFNVVVVDGAKPETGEPNTIYLVTPADGSDNKEEWLYVNGAWELIGTNHVSLDGYATETYVDGKVSTAKQEAIDAAASDATSQADTAKSEAIAEATTLANNAKSAAIEAAATDATSKADKALEDAKAYVDGITPTLSTKGELSSAKTELEGKITALTTVVNDNEADIESKLSALNTKVGNNTTAIEGINTTLEGVAKQADLNAAVSRISTNETNIANNTSAIAAINNAETGILAQAKAYSDSLDHVSATDFSALQGTVAGHTTNISDINTNLSELSGKVTTIEGAYANKTQVATDIATAKQEAIDAASTDATTKANKALEDAKGYTDEEITKLDIGSYAKTSEVTSAISASEATIQGKLDKKVESSVYTAKVAELESGIANAVAAAGTAETNAKAYTDTEVKKVSDAVAAIKTFSVRVVEALPETGEEKVIYLVPLADSTEREEYLWIENAWELIGTTHVSLDGYATETYVDGKASTAKSEAIAAAKTETEGQVSAAKTELTGAIATAKQEAIDAAASDATSKANTAETNAKAYTDTEVAKVTPESLAGTPEKKASWKSLLSFIESNEVKEITNVVAVENGVEVASKEVIKYYSIQANTAASITVSSTAVSKLSFTGANTSIELEIDGTTGETVVEYIIGSNVLTISGETPTVSITSTVAGTLKVSYIKEA